MPKIKTSFALGSLNTSFGNNAFVTGSNNRGDGRHSFLLGDNNRAFSVGEAVFGVMLKIMLDLIMGMMTIQTQIMTLTIVM